MREQHTPDISPERFSRALTSERLRVELAEAVLTVTIDRPEKRNALDRQAISELGAVFLDAAERTDILFALLRGAGNKSFAAGGDLKDLAAVQSAAEATDMATLAKSAFQAIRDFPTPVIAVLNGDALGGGAELAVACDMRVADRHARIGFIQGRLNITTAWGGCNDLTRLLGPARALRLLSRSEMLNAEAALDIGLVDFVAHEGQSLEDAEREFTTPISRQSRHVLKAFKGLVHGAKNSAREVTDNLETAQFAEAWVHDDHWAAADKLLAKMG
jgi:enoyl-CoA hydratase